MTSTKRLLNLIDIRTLIAKYLLTPLAELWSREYLGYPQIKGGIDIFLILNSGDHAAQLTFPIIFLPI